MGHYLVSGVRSSHSIAASVALQLAVDGHEVTLSAPPADRARAERFARKHNLGRVVGFDAGSDAGEAELAADLAGVPHLDGILHSIAYAPESCITGDLSDAPWDDVAVAMRVSAYSLVAMVRACRSKLIDPSSVVTLTIDSDFTMHTYNWMGVAKGALETAVRYLAREMGPAGVRVNAVAAGTVDTAAITGIEGADVIRSGFASRAPLGWDSSKVTSDVARTCTTLLELAMPVTTGAVIRADGGALTVGDSMVR